MSGKFWYGKASLVYIASEFAISNIVGGGMNMKRLQVHTISRNQEKLSSVN